MPANQVVLMASYLALRREAESGKKSGPTAPLIERGRAAAAVHQAAEAEAWARRRRR